LPIHFEKQSTFKMNKLKRQNKILLASFMIILFLSGLTAIPVERELSFLSQCFPIGNPVGEWLEKVLAGFEYTNEHYPFLAYGYDWLAFAHFVLAILFIGPYKDAVRNRWVIEFGMIACICIIPFALIAGHYRGIPFWWRLIDCSFGVLGIIPLMICYRNIKQIEFIQNSSPETINI
jgi:hypothetical protein